MASHEPPDEQRPQGETNEPPKPAPPHRTWRRRLVVALMVAEAVVIVGVTALAYWIIRSHAVPESASVDAAQDEPQAVTTWYCSMHPQITSPKPGKCAICFMDLIPLEEDSGELGPRQLRMSDAAVALAKIRTTRVERRVVAHEVRMQGKVDYDETRLVDSTAWIPGRLDRLFVDYAGVPVRQGDHLFEIYSPKLVVAQDELLLALKAFQQSTPRTREEAANNLRLVEEKLRLWGLLDWQIEEIRERGEASDHVTIYAPVGGIVIRKNANQGAYVQEGTPVYTIADLSMVWVYLDAYESDIAWLRYGQEVEFTTQSYPGDVFKGQIAFIDRALAGKSRVVRVRVNVPNDDLRLKPGMFVRAVVRSRLAAGGRVLDPVLAGKWICPMHPEIVKDGPSGDLDAEDAQKNVPHCDVCEMDLVPARELGMVAPDEVPERPLVIPVTAPLLTGKRAVVYVKLPDREEPVFEGREVLLGHRAGGYYIVRHGLEEGEEVVTAGNFKLDSALQIKAKPSMMSPEDALASVEEEDRTRLDSPGAFRVALDPVYRSYLAAGGALAADDLGQARRALDDLPTVVNAVDTQQIDSEARARWKRVADGIVFAAHDTADAQDRDAARRHFVDLSLALVWLVESFGHALPAPMIQLRCGMAMDYKGADWLQLDGEVANPYFGLARPQCGELVASFTSQAPLDVPNAFRTELAAVYGAYFELQEALADDRLPDATAAWSTMRSALDAIDSRGLGDREGGAWRQVQKTLAEDLDADFAPEDVDKVRAEFEDLSTTMLEFVEAFGHVEEAALARAYCPMAFSNKGAAWLQAGDKIANPYFGHKMLRCGEIQRTFTPAAETPPPPTDPIEEERP